MKKKVKRTLIVSLVMVIFLTATAVSTSAVTTCKSYSRGFVRTYTSDIGCGYVSAPIEMTDKSARTKVSAQTGVNLESYVAAWKSNGNLIDAQEHNGKTGTSSATIIWLVAEPTKSLHQADAEPVPGCNVHHGCIYQ